MISFFIFSNNFTLFQIISFFDQRLEFLGDTVLNFAVSAHLYRFFPGHHEGHLSLLRSSLVCNSTQALLYDELGMGDFVLTSSGSGGRQEPQGNLKRKADVFEAFVGALYLDQGLQAVDAFCRVTMFNKLQVSAFSVAHICSSPVRALTLLKSEHLSSDLRTLF